MQPGDRGELEGGSGVTFGTTDGSASEREEGGTDASGPVADGEATDGSGEPESAEALDDDRERPGVAATYRGP